MTQPTEDPQEAAGAPAPRPRRRAVRADVRIAHAALKVVRPANQQIGPWQQRAAWLLALAERRHSRGRGDDGIAREAAAMLQAVEERQVELRDSVGALPQEIATSTRLDDTAKALDSVALVLRRAIELSAPPDAG